MFTGKYAASPWKLEYSTTRKVQTVTEQVTSQPPWKLEYSTTRKVQTESLNRSPANTPPYTSSYGEEHHTVDAWLGLVVHAVVGAQHPFF